MKLDPIVLVTQYFRYVSGIPHAENWKLWMQ